MRDSRIGSCAGACASRVPACGSAAVTPIGDSDDKSTQKSHSDENQRGRARTTAGRDADCSQQVKAPLTNVTGERSLLVHGAVRVSSAYFPRSFALTFGLWGHP